MLHRLSFSFFQDGAAEEPVGLTADENSDILNNFGPAISGHLRIFQTSLSFNVLTSQFSKSIDECMGDSHDLFSFTLFPTI